MLCLRDVGGRRGRSRRSGRPVLGDVDLVGRDVPCCALDGNRESNDAGTSVECVGMAWGRHGVGELRPDVEKIVQTYHDLAESPFAEDLVKLIRLLFLKRRGLREERVGYREGGHGSGE